MNHYTLFPLHHPLRNVDKRKKGDGTNQVLTKLNIRNLLISCCSHAHHHPSEIWHTIHLRLRGASHTEHTQDSVRKQRRCNPHSHTNPSRESAHKPFQGNPWFWREMGKCLILKGIIIPKGNPCQRHLIDLSCMPSRAPKLSLTPPTTDPRKSRGQAEAPSEVRPISLLTLSLLKLLESNFPGNSLGNPYGPGNSTPLN